MKLRSFNKAFLFCFVLLSSNTSFAKEYSFKLRTIVSLSTLIPALFLHTFIHEGSHALAAISFDAKITKFEPWPNFSRPIGQFGYMEYKYRSISERQKVMIDFVPYITDMVIFSVTSTLFLTKVIKPRTLESSIVYMLGIIAPLINLSVNFFSGTDFKNIDRTSAGPYIRTIGVLLLITEGILATKIGLDIL